MYLYTYFLNTKYPSGHHLNDFMATGALGYDYLWLRLFKIIHVKTIF